jgi:hypothetical protein
LLRYCILSPPFHFFSIADHLLNRNRERLTQVVFCIVKDL